jgi:hypothetical protein
MDIARAGRSQSIPMNADMSFFERNFARAYLPLFECVVC